MTELNTILRLITRVKIIFEAKISMKLFLTIALFIVQLLGYAQKTTLVDVMGVVLDKETNQPLEYATLVFESIQNPDKITGDITDAKGRFRVEVPKGIYNINVEFVSYETLKINERNITTNTNLGELKIKLSIDQLKTVEIVREKTTVEVKLDKKIYNIGKDLTTAGGTVTDALDNVPSVTVDVDGSISLRGNENVRILINGKPSAMVSSGGSDFLSQLPADAVDKVEVITSPSARYDAEGTAGILNIILKKERALGFNGSFSLNTGYPTRTNITSNLNYRTKKFNLFSTLVYFYKTPPGTLKLDNSYETGNFLRITEDRKIEREDDGYTANLGTDYYISDKTTLTASVYGRIAEEFDLTENEVLRYDFDNDLNSELFTQEAVSEDDNTLQTSLNFVHDFNFEGHKLTADFQYSYDDESIFTRAEDVFVFPTQDLDELEHVSEQETKNEFLVQADYVLPKNDSQFELGYRGTYEQEVVDYELQDFNLTTNEFERVDALTNNFTYNENISAFYTQYGNKFGNFSFLLGLRMEYTQLKGKTISDTDVTVIEEILGEEIQLNFETDYFEPFPTVNLIYEIAEDESITLAYNRRINRPRGFFINPFPSRSSDTNIFQGNPGLLPSFSGAYDLGYLKKMEKLTLNGSLYYQRTENAFEIVRLESQENTGQEDVNVVQITPINLATNERYGIELGAIYSPEKWLRLNWTFNAFRFKNQGIYNGEDFGAEDYTWFTRFSSKVTLPAAIEWQTNFNYRGSRRNAQTKYDPIYRLDLAFSKELTDRLTATLNVRDLLNTRRRIFATTTDSFTTEGDLQFRARQFNFTLLYRLKKVNKGKGKRKKEDRSSNRPTNNGDEEGGGF